MTAQCCLGNFNHKNILALEVDFKNPHQSNSDRTHSWTGQPLHMQLDNRFEYAAKSVKLTHVNTGEEAKNWRFQGGNGRESEE